jgi:protein-tyrosine-phosphatase
MVRGRPRFPFPTRRTATLGLLLTPALAHAQSAPCPPPSVLFVCPAGTVKSAIARETLKQRAAEVGVPVRVSSRGLHVEDHVSPGLAAHLKADGLDPAREPARTLASADVSAADIVVAFDEAARVPELKGARSWDTPSWNSDYAGARAALATHIDRLLVELRAMPCPAVTKGAR